MHLKKSVKLRNIILATALSLSVLLTGCASTDTTHESNIQNKIDISKSDDSNVSMSSNNKNSSSGKIIKATVDRVVDGDTVEIILPSGKEVDTRLLLIDTPETKHPKLGVQKFGPEASDFAKSVLKPGDTVYFELDKGDKTDKYGRYLGYLWYTCPEDGNLEMYNERVVQEGLARVGYVYDQTKHLDELLATQDEAKNEKLNIWSVDGYVTDRGYDMSKVKN
ncbi:thermonuclease family protein [Paraclostridium bifermentans]|uniref:thermonuclease family protein n=1 Tax=Paraclostridium bifermentans TaxID=1490 RepID=UPI00359CA4E2